MTTDVFISVDMEGIAGITTMRQILRGTDDYPRSRQLMTDEANAAVNGAFEGGATRVVVSDSHGDMGNLLADRLDRRAELVAGTPKLPWSMLTGIEKEFACALFVGYHAGGGTGAAVMDHTYTGFFFDVRVNGDSWNETFLNAALAGSFGVPVGLVTGDDKTCEQAKRLKGVRTVAVKHGIGRHVATSLSPQVAHERIRRAALESVQAHRELLVFKPTGPFKLEVDMVNTSCTELAALAPGTERTGPRTVAFEAPDVREMMRCLLAWMYLARHAAPTYSVD
jgi:D-amino peptidase